ncbi:MAG TPA: hypothetical protein VMZ31_09545 [Phycisphaerae bacterium]|nr:hypothetical protein [Phycisphaerae bacterium]
MTDQNDTSAGVVGPRDGQAESGRPDPRRTFNEVLRVVHQRQRVFLVPFCLTITAALLASHYIPRSYTASTIFERRDDVVIADLVRQNSPHSFDTIRRSLDLDLKGPAVVVAAIAEVAGQASASETYAGKPLPVDPVERQEFLAGLVEDINLKMLEKSNYLDLIEVSCRGRDPVLVQRLANHLRDRYVERTRERITSVLEDAKGFFEAQTAKHQGVMERLEGEIVAMEEAYPGVRPGEPATVYTQLTVLENKRDQLESKKRELQAKIGAHRRFLDNFGSLPVVDQSGQLVRGPLSALDRRRVRLEAQISQVRDEITDLMTVKQMTEHHPAVVALNQKLERLQSQFVSLAAEPQPGEDSTPAVAVADSESATWLSQRGAVEMELEAAQEILAAAEREWLAVNERIMAAEQLQDKVVDRRQSYRNKLAALDRAKADVAAWRSNLERVSRHLTAEQQDRGIQFATLEEAGLNLRPVWPRASTVFVLALVLGVAAGSGCVALAELLDRSFRTVGQLRRSLNLPILESVSEIVTPALRRRRLVGQLVIGPAIAVVLMVSLVLAGTATYLRLERPEFYQTAQGESANPLHESGGVNGGPQEVAIETWDA